MEYLLLNHKKESNLTICDDMMDLKGMMLSEMSDRERQIPYDHIYMWNIENKINRENRNRLKDTENKLMVDKGEKYG